MRLTGCIGWVKHIYVHRNVDKRACDSLFQLLNNTGYPNTIDVSGFNHLEPAADVISHVTFGPNHWRSDPGMNRSVTNQSFLVSDMKEGAMVHTSVTLISQLKFIVRLNNTYAYDDMPPPRTSGSQVSSLDMSVTNLV